jgi:hypothetical protein
MARPAEQGELIEIGFAFARCVPRHGVVHLAAAVVGAAQYAVSVSKNQGVPLHQAGVTFRSPEPERLTVGVIQHAEDVGVLEVFGKYRVRNLAEPYLSGHRRRVKPEVVVEGHADKDLWSARLGRAVVAGCAGDPGWGGRYVADELVSGIEQQLGTSPRVELTGDVSSTVGFVEFVGSFLDLVPHVFASDRVAFETDRVEPGFLRVVVRGPAQGSLAVVFGLGATRGGLFGDELIGERSALVGVDVGDLVDERGIDCGWSWPMRRR